MSGYQIVHVNNSKLSVNTPSSPAVIVGIPFPFLRENGVFVCACVSQGVGVFVRECKGGLYGDIWGC